MGLSGIVVVNKSSGMTSHDVVAKARLKLKMKKIGHAGTLDPLATGVLILLVGKSTKLFDKFVVFDKGYNATLILGMSTNSADVDGKLTGQLPYDHITEKMVIGIFKRFIGEIEQVPPMVSAVKMKGKKLYELARKGITVKRASRKVRVDCLDLERFESPYVDFHLECSKGTYVRQIAEDAGKVLGCGACISRIERTRVGPFLLRDAINLENLNESHIRNWQG